mgnify:CR=1 FL=1
MALWPAYAYYWQLTITMNQYIIIHINRALLLVNKQVNVFLFIFSIKFLIYAVFRKVL